jgi:CBS domain-containing protein
MSPRAAWRLDSLGFAHVHDYAAGEADWFAYSLPRAGRDTSIPRVGDIAQRDVPICRLDDRVGAVRERLRTTGWDTCLLLNDERVVLGRLHARALDAAAETPVEDVMEAGPTTFRPDVRLTAVLDRMREKTVEDVVVTTPGRTMIL